MQIELHKAGERGGADHGWLKTKHSFSFAHWYEPSRMGFGKLRVINDDWIAPHEGFGPHQHKDMEIITVVTAGVLTHEDSLGNKGTIPPGDVQVMSAGSGVVHAERNDGDVPLTLFQIWIEAKEKGIHPRYGQQAMQLEEEKLGLKLLVAPLNTPEVLTINQDAFVHYGLVDSDTSCTYTLNNPEHGVYLFLIEGALHVAGQTLGERDALGITGTPSILITGTSTSKFLLFEVPM